MTASVIATTVTTPDTTRTYTVTINGVDLSGDTFHDSLAMEDQGTAVQGTTSFLVTASQATYPRIIDQGLVTIEDHMSASAPIAFRGFITSRKPTRLPAWSEVSIVAEDHTSLLDVIIPYELRPAGESDNARIGYLWGLYAGEYLQGSLALVNQVNASLPAQQFAGVTLRQALDLIAAQASTSASWLVDTAGRLNYGTSAATSAPQNVTSDTPGGGEIAPLDLSIDADSKGYVSGVYVRGKTDDGSGWVYSDAARAATNGVRRTRFLDAPDSTTSAMRDAAGNAFLAKLGSALTRGSFTCTSDDSDGWRAGQGITVRSTHLGNINTTYRIARVRTSVLGPRSGRPAGLRKYEVEFGSASTPSSGDTGPVVGTGIVGDLLDDGGNLLLGSGSSAATSGFGGALRRFISSGVYNGDFGQAPPYPDSPIVQVWNPLPFWTFTQASGTAITASAIADSSSGSGRVIRFDMAAGAAGDDAYLEQLIPVNASRGRSYTLYCLASFLTSASVSVAKMYITGTWLKADQVTTTGTGATLTRTTTAAGASTLVDLYAPSGVNAVVPSDAYYLRVRVGFQRDAAATTVVESVTLCEVRIAAGNTTAMVTEGFAPSSYGPLEITQLSGNAIIAANQLGGSGSTPKITLLGNTTTPIIQLSATTGSAALRYGGTSFPSSPTTDDLYFRTDVNGWYYYTGAAWNGAGEVDYVEKTSNTSITATTEATANTIVTGNAVTYDGATRVKIEFWAWSARPDATVAGRTLDLVLYDGATSIGLLGEMVTPAANASQSVVHAIRWITPSAAAHTYSVRAFVSAGSGVVYAGAGGIGAQAPAFIRISTV